MDTSGDGIVTVILYLAVLSAFIQVAVRMLPLASVPRRFPLVALALTVLIGVPSLLQFVWPQIDAALRRAPSLTVDQGQWWRVLTAVAAQDGGLVAAIFNLFVVALVTWLSEWIWGRWRTAVLFLLPSLVLNLLAIAWGSPGGGSSFASDGLLMSVCALGLVASRLVVVRALAVATLAIAVVLVLIDDAHGVAMLVGAAAGVVMGIPFRGLIRASGPARAD